MPTLYSIQYLRALAAIAVVVFHAGERSGMHFAIGAAGVDVFFVMSGFIMMAISDQRPTRPISFLRNRFLRIAPSYWAATAVMLLGGAVGLFPNLQIDLLHTLAAFLFVPAQSPSNGEMWPVLVQGWTLNYEMFFYLVFAGILFTRPGLRLWILAAIFILLAAIGSLLQPSSDVLRFYTAPVILEFVAGAALARLWRNGALPTVRTGALLVAVAVGGFAAIQILHLEFGPWSCGPLAVMLVAGALSVETSGKLPNLPLLHYLGDSSFSIYLWHTFAISVTLKIAATLGLPPLLLIGTCIITGVFAGILAYEGLERPIQFLLRGRRSSLWRLPLRKAAP